MVRPFQRKFSSVDWSKLSKKLTDSKAKSALASLQQTYGEVYADANKYLKEPAEIDFEHYKSIIKTKGLVEAFEVFCIDIDMNFLESDVIAFYRKITRLWSLRKWIQPCTLRKVRKRRSAW